MKMSRVLLAIFFAAAASLLGNDELKERLQPALDAITPDGLLAHIKVLASDEFEGRSPGTKGEELSVKYITDQFKQIGLKPGNPDGTYTQQVPLAGIKSEPRMSFVVGDKTMDLKYSDDFVASSARLQPEIKIEKSDVVFVGYGVVAPEYGWDDYKNVDVRGKTLLMLIGNPNKNMDAVSARSWITLDVAKKFFSDSGQNFDAVKKSAVTKDFQPIILN